MTIDAPRFVHRPAHRLWLLSQARTLFDMFQYRALNPRGGFFALDVTGHPIPAVDPAQGVERPLHATTRMVHCFSIAHLMGLPGADRMIDHGMDFIWSRHRDRTHGGYFWAVNDVAATDSTKQAYGHGFVLLAASSAKVAGHPDADRLLADISEVLDTRFWEPVPGATSEEYAADWSKISDYRGQNSNMHLTEALMAAFEATGDALYLSRAESIAGLIINRHARAEGWRVAEHFDSDWTVDRDYAGSPMFRPSGTTPGHALEWSRLLVQLWELGGRAHAWMLEASKALFRRSVTDGWEPTKGGFYYTIGWDGEPSRPDRYWWPAAEAIGAAAMLASVDPDPFYEEWYRRVWSFVTNHFIDHEHGGWIPELDSDLKPIVNVFVGKPDLYHSVQACLIPLLPAEGSLTKGLRGPKAAALLG